MGDFHFLRPEWLLGLIPAILILALLWHKQTTTSAWRALFDQALLSRLWLEPPGHVSRKPLLLVGFGWLLAIIILATPVWEQQPEVVWHAPISRVLILDLSASMNATDVAPSRLERARFKLMDILDKSKEGRTGLIVFAGEAHIVTPLTEDNQTILNLLTALSPEIVPQVGDAAAPALQMAGDLLKQTGVQRGELLLISDGISDAILALNQINSLRADGHRVSVLGIGTEQGGVVLNKEGDFKEYAKFYAAPLQELATAGGGVFSRFTANDNDLNQVLLGSSSGESLDQSSGSGVDRWVEHGVWLLPILLLLAAFAFRRGWLLCFSLLMIMPPPAQAFGWRDLWLRSDQQAEKILQQGDAQNAAQKFQDPSWRGMALYNTGDYQAAAQAFAEADAPDANYNRGNALARAGDLEQAVSAYQDMLAKQPEHEDAKANLKLVEELLEQQESEQNDESDQQDGDDSEQTTENDSASEDNSDEQTADDSPEPDDFGEENDAESDPSETEAEDTTADEPKGMPQPQPDDEIVNELPSEEEIALEQWLRQIPEDPAGLLRRKFMLEHLQRKKEQP